jgi:hypothetical protein
VPSSALRFAIVAAASILALSACTKGTQSTSTTATQSVTAAPASPAGATNAPLAQAGTAGGSAVPVAVGTPTIAPPAGIPSASASAAGVATVAFTDINGADGADAIRQLAFLGVLEATSGQFRPHDPISRAEYVRWLVRANNAYFATHPDKRIRLAETGQSTFVDVQPANADFKYIQGMSDAGYVIGIDAKHFAPSRNLSREELVAILISRDNGGAGMPNAGPPSTWNYAGGGGTLSVQLTDRDKVSKPYWGAFQVNNGWGNSYAVDVVHRVYGTIKVFHPQQLATRADAAIALQEIDHVSAASLVPKN